MDWTKSVILLAFAFGVVTTTPTPTLSNEQPETTLDNNEQKIQLRINEDEHTEQTPMEIIQAPIPTKGSSEYTVSADGSIVYINTTNNPKDKRNHIRFKNEEITYPIFIKKTENIIRLLDFSRGGIAVQHNNSVKVGDVLPVQINYKYLSISTQIEIISTTKNKAGAKFINTNKDISNQLLHLSILLEADNNLIASRINK